MYIQKINIYEQLENSINMKKIIFTILGICFSTILAAQTMHTMIFVNESEPGREIDRRADSRNMQRFFTEIAYCLNYRNNMHSHSGAEFTATCIDRDIENLNVGNNDVVVFYYSGHGANLRNDKWPTLDLLDKPYWSSRILAKLNAKCANAKLVLFITDCCNSYINSGIVPTSSLNPVDDNNVAKLFTGFKGKKKVIITAAKPGQSSISDPRYGAWFGISFRQAVKENTSNDSSNPTWEKVMQDARRLTLLNTRGDHQHEPQWSIEQSADPFDD